MLMMLPSLSSPLIKEDIQFLANCLNSFGEVTGLVTNCSKSLVAPIRCGNIDLDDILSAFLAVRTSSPMRYLGLSLSVKRLKRIHFQHLEDKVAGKLPSWQGRHVASAGRVVLIKAALTAIAIYHLTPLDIPVEVSKKIDSIRRAYLWASSDKVSGGKCKVNWDLVCKPKKHEGLGVLNLDKFAKALRLRWLWFEWTDSKKPWIGMGTPCTDKDRDFFAAATSVTVGNGCTAMFWNSSWLHGLRPRDIAPSIFDLSRKKNCSVQQALASNLWISNIDISNGLTLTHVQQFADLWEKISTVTLAEDVEDSIIWKFTKDGKYSASSTYKAQFEGLISSDMVHSVWRVWAPPRCKFFAWLVLQNRIWTSDRLIRRGWPNCRLCPLCKQSQESVAHLLFQCRYILRVWNDILSWLGMHHIITATWMARISVRDWWNGNLQIRSGSPKALASLMMLIS